MSAPESNTSADQALSSFMGAAIGAPETSLVDPHDDTLARTGNTADHQAGWFAGIKQGQANARDAPPPLNDDLIEILGRPNFACGQLATLLRAGGHVIKNKAEHEQAAVIHFLLGHYLKHGNDWHERVGAAFEAIAAQQGKGDEA
ncbi:hypothetical protein [Achromobacter aegrifaciens]|uniref:Uncharacterized protein n=1 Tax=Achromobacter aegrifaciens TaxID=1287736 RepID=A0ABU2DM12_ACHAE|nr:hypothetical protein [Achromobacter aegrifaciens]MDR7949171.1 hypothetical protein [Achromobacter aegrifaciens]RSF08837.1 hypothetical protein EGU54_02315 [Achromobacter aegrifaciens]